MPTSPAAQDLIAAIQFAGSLCQVGTALIAAAIGVVTFRYTKRQSALVLINQNNALANLVNTTVINSEPARNALGKLQDCIVGCPDDAVLFLYLNYVHNTYRMHEIGAVGAQVWRDTLAACAGTMGGLRRDQVERLLARGYETRFQEAVLARHDDARASQSANDKQVLTTLRPRARRLARAG